MTLNQKQSRYLRGLGHQRKVVVTIGQHGLSAAVIAEIKLSLEHHELMKIRIGAEDRDQRDALIAALCAEVGCHLVQRVGNIALIYRPAEIPRLTLP
ncbi:MAG: YhbY family RNA-binding protein [Gammaproteobacteria bacterium]|nr:YhbY family RNA-binding protein [Gammaproteobacteria bacterium]